MLVLVLVLVLVIMSFVFAVHQLLLLLVQMYLLTPQILRIAVLLRAPIAENKSTTHRTHRTHRTLCCCVCLHDNVHKWCYAVHMFKFMFGAYGGVYTQHIHVLELMTCF